MTSSPEAVPTVTQKRYDKQVAHAKLMEEDRESLKKLLRQVVEKILLLSDDAAGEAVLDLVRSACPGLVTHVAEHGV